MLWSNIAVANEPFTLDKKIPIAVLLALVVQFVGTISYVVTLDNRVAGLEKAITASTAKDNEASREDRLILERLVRVEAKLEALIDYVRRIDAMGKRTDLP